MLLESGLNITKTLNRLTPATQSEAVVRKARIFDSRVSILSETA